MKLVQTTIYFEDYYIYGSRLSGTLLQMIAPSGTLFFVESEVRDTLVSLGWFVTPQDADEIVIESGK